ncbi:MAG: glucosidase [Acidobacteriota bacterium]|nr:glucosidase [Acidobacteriota bacterium]
MLEKSEKAEEKRLAESDSHEKDWKLWGCYVAERAWGTVREDYSADGAAWDYFPFEQAQSKAFRWNEDGIAGICDRKQNLCFAVSLWNGKDAILKERFFGLNGNTGNHGEDVKEYYFYLDNTPTHSYMKFLYKYPQIAFPYQKIYEENAQRDKSQPEYELIDTGVFDEDKYFDVFIEYAKADADDICIKITAINRGKETARIHLLPTIWFRNVWSWESPKSKVQSSKLFASDSKTIEIENGEIGNYRLICENADELLFCENETNYQKLYGGENKSNYTKDGIGDYVAGGDKTAVNAEQTGTKATAHYVLELQARESKSIYLRLKSDISKPDVEQPINAEEIFQKRIAEADEFYAAITPDNLNADEKLVMRQSLGGMLWSKQFYHYVVKDWLEGDGNFAAPPKERLTGRNCEWTNLYNDDVISMPDKWEYPWYAAWDLAFHTIPLALVDSEFAKRQLVLLLREWFMHPNGQIPAYEWKFSDVNPPVHAWAAFRVYKIEAKRTGVADREFLEKVFHKLLLNFTWWVNRKDYEGNNVFEGGFLGLDNIGVFDRSADLPTGGHLEQSDGTSWMAMFCLNMLAIAMELAKEDVVYEDVASKFFEHFVYISDAMNNVGHENTELWNERDGFYYDVLHLDGEQIPLKVRSMVGLIPLFAVETLEADWLENLPSFKKRTEWFLKNRPDLTGEISCMQQEGKNNRHILALVNKNRLERILRYLLSETEFLSDYGIRSLSRFHKANPYDFELDGNHHEVAYEPGESKTGMFGGNSNWRGPVWFPMNYLLIESLQKFDFYYGEEFKVEFPTGSGVMMTLWEVSQELEKRLCKIFLKDESGNRPVFGNVEKFQTDENWRDHILFCEYFHGDNGRGLGASHQTGWTGLMGKILQQLGEYKHTENGANMETTIRFRFDPKTSKIE